jgi:DNA-binding CsgD family transcriptional regulator
MGSMTLSHRETEVLGFVAEGKTTKEIAATLGIADSTVNWHVARVLVKLEASSRAEAVAAATRAGLLRGEDDAANVETRTTRIADVAVLGLPLASVTVETRRVSVS